VLIWSASGTIVDIDSSFGAVMAADDDGEVASPFLGEKDRGVR